jgi:hypothetical protein
MFSKNVHAIIFLLAKSINALFVDQEMASFVI